MQPARAPAAFVVLLLLAGLLGGSVIAARITLDHGTSVPTAVAVRSFATATVVGALCVWCRVSARVTTRQGGTLAGIGALLAVQSLCLCSAVRQIPVGRAVLAFNTYPLWIALAARLPLTLGLGTAVAASWLYALALVLTQHEVAALDGRLRSAATLSVAGRHEPAVTPFPPIPWTQSRPR